MTDIPSDFDPESRKERGIAGKADRDRSDFLSLMGHSYRGELGRMKAWRTRIDRTTNWGVVVTATLLTWAFSTESRPHFVLLVGMVMLNVFLAIEVRRYRIYDIWRSRVRLLEEHVFANALDPAGAEQSGWRELLSKDLRQPTIKTPAIEAVSRRLRRVYLPLYSLLLGAWFVRLAVFATADMVSVARIGSVPGSVVIGVVSVYYVGIVALTFWPTQRQAKGELTSTDRADEWK